MSRASPLEARGPGSHKKNKCICISRALWQIQAPEASRHRPPGQRLRAQLWFAEMINLWVVRMRNVSFLGLGKTKGRSWLKFPFENGISRSSSGQQPCRQAWLFRQLSLGRSSGRPKTLLAPCACAPAGVGCQPCAPQWWGETSGTSLTSRRTG